MDITEQLIKLYFMYKGIRVYRYIDIQIMSELIIYLFMYI